MDSDGEGSPGRGAAVARGCPEVARAFQASVGDDVARGFQASARTAVTGVVTAQLPRGLYRVRLDGGGGVVAHIADRIDRNFVRVLVGDHVKVELSPVDTGRGRIVEKL